MPKINQEEYEVLKELDDKWKWIARDEDGDLSAYQVKPEKHVEFWISEGGYYLYLGSKAFQFVQWEDEEPFNIAELIEEYESEGTEVKDNEWAIKEIEGLEIESSQDYPHDEMIEKEIVLSILDQLDEPEVLSQEWIDEHAEHHEYIGYAGVPVDDLQNLLVPEQEEVDRAYRKGFKEGERQTVEYFESITEEPSKEQVWKYLSEHGIEVVDKEPETVGSVLADFFKSLERLKEVMSMEVEELEE